MRVVIDGRYVNDHFPGIGRYVYNLLSALGELATVHTFAVLYNPDLPNTRYDMAALAKLPSLRLVATQLRPFSLREQTQLPRLLRSLQTDLFHATYYVRPYFGLSCPSITTLYDTIPRLFPAEVSPRARLLFSLLMRQAVRSSQHVLAISASARQDLIDTFGIAPERITVTALAADPRFAPQPAPAVASLRANYGLPERYLLALSSNKPHKNLVALVEAYAMLGAGSWELGVGGAVTRRDVGVGRQVMRASGSIPVPQLPARIPALVIAGHWDERYPQARAAVERLGLGTRVRFLPNVAEADLPALYSGAELFVFPSRYEGFGLPALEALACGAPVVASNRSSLPEVVGDAAVLVEPNAAALADGMARVLRDETLRLRLRAHGPERAAAFSWRNTAQATLAVYEHM